LNVRAAEWFLKNNDIEDAFNHYVNAGRMEEAVAFTEDVCRAYYAQGHLETLLDWQQKLGYHAASATQLSCVCAMIHIDRYEYGLAEKELREARRLFKNQYDATGLLEVTFLNARLRLLQGDTEDVVQELDSLLQQEELEVPMQARALHMLGLAYLNQGDNLLAVKCLEKASTLHESLSNRSAIARVLQDLEVAYNRCGRLDDASACLQRGVAMAVAPQGGAALALNNLGYHYHQRGDYEQAHITLRRSDIAERTSSRRGGYLLWSMGDVERDLSNFSEALLLYQRALELNQNNEPELHCFLILSMSTLYRWRDELRDAGFLAEEALALAERYRFTWQGLVADAFRWLTRAEQAEPAAALLQLDSILEQLKEQHALLGVCKLGICARVAVLAEDKAARDAYFAQALDIAHARQNTQPFFAEVWHTLQLRRLVESDPRKYGIIVHGLHQLEQNTVQATALAVVQDMAHTPTCTLRIFTLGDDKIERDGVPVEISKWRAHKARELFYYLLFMGAKRREEICLEFWPDSSTDQVRSNFHTTLYRTRQALGEDVIVYKNDVYMINLSLDIWCDAKQLEALTNQARLLPLSDVRAEDLWRRAVNVYRGEFLTSVDAQWAITQREIYDEMYMEALMGTGNCARARRDYQTAIRIYKRCLKFDPYRRYPPCPDEMLWDLVKRVKSWCITATSNSFLLKIWGLDLLCKPSN
jgi:tetratricopeptide (TPR) repeat protein